jgi:hypothetical protein
VSKELKSAIRATKRVTPDDINRKFDNAELIVERTGALLSKSKPVLLELFFVVHLVLDLGLILWFVLRK